MKNFLPPLSPSLPHLLSVSLSLSLSLSHTHTNQLFCQFALHDPKVNQAAHNQLCYFAVKD